MRAIETQPEETEAEAEAEVEVDMAVEDGGQEDHTHLHLHTRPNPNPMLLQAHPGDQVSGPVSDWEVSPLPLQPRLRVADSNRASSSRIHTATTALGQVLPLLAVAGERGTTTTTVAQVQVQLGEKARVSEAHEIDDGFCTSLASRLDKLCNRQQCSDACFGKGCDRQEPAYGRYLCRWLGLDPWPLLVSNARPPQPVDLLPRLAVVDELAKDDKV